MLSRCSFVSEPLRLVASWTNDKRAKGVVAQVPSEAPRKSRRPRYRFLKELPFVALTCSSDLWIVCITGFPKLSQTQYCQDWSSHDDGSLYHAGQKIPLLPLHLSSILGNSGNRQVPPCQNQLGDTPLIRPFGFREPRRYSWCLIQ